MQHGHFAEGSRRLFHGRLMGEDDGCQVYVLDIRNTVGSMNLSSCIVETSITAAITVT
jgi:hypothetical protein